MGARAEGPAAGPARRRRRLTDDEFATLMKEARAEARRITFGRPATGDTDFAWRTQHAEFGGAAH